MKNKIILKLKVILAIFIFYNCSLSDKNLKPLIDEDKLKSYTENFNNDDEELYSNISNKDALNFLQKNLSREEGIRTLDTLLTHTRFPSVRLKPLGHLSFLNLKT